MRATQLADRYAAALRTAIGDTQRLETAAEALNVIAIAYQSDHQVRFALANPVLPLDARKKILDTAVTAYPVPIEVQRLLNMLLEQNRMILLPIIAARFEVHIDEWLDRVEVTTITAVPLTPQLEKNLVESLQKFSRKTVRLNAVVDPKILGGLIVLMWGVFFDFSLRTRLERLKQKLLAEEMLTYGH